MPFLRARRMISVRISPTSWRTSAMFLQMPVPISMTDWCISGLTRSFRTSLPSSRISWTWERSSRVSGSMIWNSSSTPRVKAGRSIEPGSGARRAAAGADGAGGAAGFLDAADRRLAGRPDRRRPARNVASGSRSIGSAPLAATRSISHCVAVLERPTAKFSSPTESTVGVGRGVQEVDRVGNAVAHRELERVEVVAERVHQLQAVAADALVHRRVDRRRRPGRSARGAAAAGRSA